MTYKLDVSTIRKKLIPALRMYKKSEDINSLLKIKDTINARLHSYSCEPVFPWTDVYGDTYKELNAMYKKMSKSSLDICLDNRFPGALYAFVNRYGFFPAFRKEYDASEWYALFFLTPKKTLRKAMPWINDYVREYINNYDLMVPNIIRGLGLCLNRSGPFYDIDKSFLPSSVPRINIEHVQALHDALALYAPEILHGHLEGAFSEHVQPDAWLQQYVNWTTNDLSQNKYISTTSKILDAWKKTFQSWYRTNEAGISNLMLVEKILQSTPEPKSFLNLVEWMYDTKLPQGITHLWNIHPEGCVKIIEREISYPSNQKSMDSELNVEDLEISVANSACR